jgi:WS/DGAT/MGAT family acyltransferase
MKQLSGLDASFLFLETPEMPMHVGALHLYELPAGFKGQFITAVRRHIQARLPATPALRRRLWLMPLNLANPAWVDAEPDLKLHVVPGEAPKGATLADLEDAVARLHPQLLDRSRPLWKFHVFENIAPGPGGRRRAALYTQLHHAAVDGQAAVALANALLDLSPEPRKLELRPSSRQKVFKLEMTEMLRGVIGNQAGKIAQIIRELPATVGTLKNAATEAVSHASLLGGRKGPANITLAPPTPFNRSVTTGRSFASVTLPLAEVKALGRAHGATLNEMVLMLCSSALRRVFTKRRTLPRKSLVAAVPITLRAKGDTAADNQASMSLISLGTNVADPARRLAHVKAASAAMKSAMGPLKSILPTDFPSLGVPWLLEAATALVGKARVADRIPQVANVVISNVPGPPVPLYMAGARMLTNYPTSIVVHGMGLNITVQSYDASLDFGLMADAKAMPEVRELADALRIAWDDLQLLPRPGDPEPVDAAAAESLVGRAQRAVRGAVKGTMGTVGTVTRKVADQALDNAVQRVAGTALRRVTGAATQAAKGATKTRSR